MGEVIKSLETTLAQSICEAGSRGCPPQLADALRWAVFPGGARIRPRLCLAVARCCGADQDTAVAPAAALELLHCASLVHDDLPCFDNASMRRGRTSVQYEFGQQLAVLAGDGLIVIAFELLNRRLSQSPLLLGPLLSVVARSVSAPHGIVAGQAWECESQVDLEAYHQAKTGALFAAATEAGAISANVANSAEWSVPGALLGRAYQVADDIIDAAGRVEDVGKPVRQDSQYHRPNCVERVGLSQAVEQLRQLVDAAIDAIPECSGKNALSAQIRLETDRMLPARIVELAA